MSTGTARTAVITLALIAAGWAGANAQAQTPAFGLEGPFGASVSTTQAGAHPDATTSFTFVTAAVPNSTAFTPVDQPKDIDVAIPPGLVGNPRAATSCDTATLLNALNTNGDWCPRSAMVGLAGLTLGSVPGPPPQPLATPTTPVFKVVPPRGVAASFAFQVANSEVVRLDARVRSDGDYGVSISTRNISAQLSVINSQVTLWGVPADHSGPGPFPLNSAASFFPDGQTYGGKGQGERLPFITNPSECGVARTTGITLNSFQDPTNFLTYFSEPTTIDGCDQLEFHPQISTASSSITPDSPTGLNVGLDLPQNDQPDELGTPPLRKAVVTLPEGMTINPAAADGLQACSDAELGLGSVAPATCPGAAKVGSVTAITPVLDEPVQGGVYIRPQASDDPESGAMFRIALVLNQPERGIVVKLPGSVKANKDTGRLTATFDDNPQLPVSKIDVRFTGGPRAAVATSPGCGNQQTTAQLTAWSDHTVNVSDSYTSSCPAGLGGFSPSLTAGTVGSDAGAFDTFTLGIHKPDGNAAINGLTMSLPAGLVAQLKGNLNTQVGSVKAYAGPGANPFMLPGKVFLEGRYDDAPFSLRVVVPAKAGPFDLGTVEVRQKIYVDPITAHVTVISDRLPTIVKGVPARLQRLDVNVDKPGFIMNPTSCAAKTITGTLGSAAGQSVVVTNHFQASDCASLDLKPDLALSLSGKGQTTDNKHPAVTATVSQKPGQANLKKVRVALPLSVALDPDNANGLCEFVDGSKVVPTCPKASIVGSATATTPILDEPLSGPVYFVKNIRKDPKSGREIRTLPKLVVPLVGQNGLRLTLTGTSDVDHDQLVTTFDNIPDAPVSSFKMNIIGGKGGILVVSGTDICKSTQIADQQIDGQNNKNADADVYIQTPSCPLKVISKKVAKTSVAVKIGGLGAGKITITGKGIRKTTKTISKSTVATITAKRTKAKPGKLTVSFDPTGPAKAHKTTK